MPLLTKVDKPWGYELLWAQTPNYAAKILFIRKGEQLSLQYHERKDETVMLDSGRMLLNGKHLALRGASMHEEDPTRGAARGPAEISANIDLRRDMVDDRDVIGGRVLRRARAARRVPIVQHGI